jgi:CRISPR-associated endonuclease/helicase Cas3
MCPAHRLRTIDEIKQRLAVGADCQLVSTQLIEAGVDIDFPRVFREIAPLEAIIQAAGRCNREGKLPFIGGRAGGEVVVFRSADGATLPDQWYQAGIRVVEQDFLASGREPDITRPEDIEEYFRRLYKTGELDAHDIQDLRKRGDFAEVGRLYRLIDQETTPVVVATWDPARADVEALIEQFRTDPSRRNLRRLAPYQVNLRNDELDQAQGAIVQEPSGLRVWFGPYDPHIGLIVSGDRDLPPV